MAIAEELQVLIRAETQNAVRNLQQFQKQVGASEKSAASFAKSVAMGAGAALVSYQSLKALVGFLGSSVKAYQEQEKAERLLSVAMQASGENAAALLPKYKQLASQIQRTTTVGDEQTLALTRLAYSYGIQGDRVEEAVKGAIGLSKAYGVDMQTALRGVANAYQGNTEQLARYIPALRTAGTEAEKNAALQKAMAAGFKIAEEEARSSAGQIKQLGNAFGDLKEILGDVVAEKATPFVSWLRDVFQLSADAAQKTRDLAKAADAIKKGREGELSLETRYAYYQAEILNNKEKIKELDDSALLGFRKDAYKKPLEEQNMLYEEKLKAIQQQMNADAKAGILKGKENAAAEAAAKRAAELAEERRKREMLVADAIEKQRLATVERIAAEEGQMVRNAVEAGSEALPDVDLYAQHLDAMEYEHKIYVENAKKLSEEEANAAKVSAAEMERALVGAYQTISSNVMDLWAMQLQYSRQAGDAEISRLNRQLQTFEENYAAELKLREDMGLDTVAFQEEMNTRQQALEDAVAQRTNALKKKQFEQEKKLSIAQTIMSGAEAAVKAWEAGPFAGPALAALITAFTAAKVGMIQSQKYPAMAEGGIVNPTPGGSLVRVAEAGKPEAIVPLDKGFGNITVIINAEVIGGREEVSMWVHEGILRAQKMGRI